MLTVVIAHTLNLGMNNSISSNTETSSCNSYEWNGMIFENSGTYEFDTTATNGCDSTAFLELEICYLDQLEINGPTAAVTTLHHHFQFKIMQVLFMSGHFLMN